VARQNTIIDNYEIFIWLGVAAFFFTGMLGIVGMTVLFRDGDSVLGNMCAVALVVLICGGAAMMAIGLKGRAKHKELEKVADLLKAYRRIEISKLASKMGVTPMDAENTIVECLGRELVEGYFDRQEGEFFTKEALYQVMEIDRCPNCGAPATDLYLVGEEIQCKYCGSVTMARGKRLNGGSS
jgi:DNA-directed RNA polymerase subunit RPC12/RpoP